MNDISVGDVFGRLTVLSIYSKYDKRYCRCICTCGGIAKSQVHSLISGKTKSCGCMWLEAIKKANTTHKLTGTPTYKTWIAMKKHATGHIESWDTFINFYNDMGERPYGKYLHRKDTTLGFSKDNCEYGIMQRTNTTCNVIKKLQDDLTPLALKS